MSETQTQTQPVERVTIKEPENATPGWGVPLYDQTIGDQWVQFRVRTDGRFVAVPVGADGVPVLDEYEQLGQARTLDDLAKTVTQKLRKARAKLAIRFFDPSKGKNRTVTGFHARTGNMLVTTDGEKGSEQASYTWSWHNEATPEQVAQYAQLVAAQKAAADATAEFVKGLGAEVRETIRKAKEGEGR